MFQPRRKVETLRYGSFARRFTAAGFFRARSATVELTKEQADGRERATDYSDTLVGLFEDMDSLWSCGKLNNAEHLRVNRLALDGYFEMARAEMPRSDGGKLKK